MRLLVLIGDAAEDAIEMTLPQFVETFFPDLHDGLAIDAREEFARVRAAIDAVEVNAGVDHLDRDYLVGTPWAVTEYLSRPGTSRPEAA